MADILDLIKGRRTIKHFDPKFVAWEKIARIVDAGRHAPSCGNIQNWKFIVVQDAGKKQALGEACYEQYEISQAHTLIIVCAEPQKAERYYGLRGERLYSIQNCAAAAMCMMLEAQSLDLGTAWIGAFDEDAVRDITNIPPEARPQAILAIGHAREIPPRPAKYPLEVVTYIEKWRGKYRDIDKYMNNTAAIMARKVVAAKDMAEKGLSSLKENVSAKFSKKKDDEMHEN
ncbi:TPA: nitroreductase family protein [Candidatus Woesearchaeota archaeon]|nr:nitroreductase family protein [Candidatus Woesearchaeota archaeon]